MIKFRTNLFLTGILVLLISLYFYIKSSDLFEEDKTFLDIETGSLSGMEIKSEKALEFRKTEGRWILSDGVREYSADQARMLSIEKSLENFEYRRIVEKKSADPARFGFEEPELTMVVYREGGGEDSVLIGGATTSGSQYYAMKSGDNAVYTIDRGLIENLRGTLFEFRDKKIIDLEWKTVESVIIKNSTYGTVLLSRDKNDGWEITEPVRIDADAESVNELLGSLGSLSMQDAVDFNQNNQEKFGLASPRITIDLKTRSDDGETVYFGRTDNADSMSSCMIAGGDEIFLVPHFSPEKITLDSLLFFAPLSISTDEVKAVRIITQEKEYEFRTVAGNDEPAYYLGDRIIAPEDYFALYVNLMALTADGFNSSEKEGSPLMSVTLQMNNATQISIELFESNPDHYSMKSSINPHSFLVKKQKVDLVSRWLEKIQR